MPISAKKFREDLKQKGVFYTDEKLARKMKDLLPENVTEVYDPTCGDGALLSVFGDDVLKFGQDILPEQVQYAREHLQNFEGIVGDTLMEPAFIGHKFQAIVANPPFSIKWDPDSLKDDPRFICSPTLPTKGKADYAFLLHILYCLSDDGTAVALSAPGVLFRGQREGKIREWFVRQNDIDKVIHVPGGYFEDTKIPTAILVLKKNRTSTDIEFSDWEHDLSRMVPFSEIESNAFILSVQHYVQPDFDAEEEKVDPIAQEMELRKLVVSSLRQSIEISRLIGQIENISITPFLDELDAVIREYRKKEKSDDGRGTAGTQQGVPA